MSQGQQVVRETLPYKATHQIFIQKEKNYIQQYSHIYLKRLLALRPQLRKFLESQNVVIAEKVIALKMGEDVGVIGTIYKDQKLKPNVLDEFSSDFGAPLAPKLENYCSDDDTLLLEDESGRCVLIGDDATKGEWKQRVSSLISGVVVACIGKLTEAGDFAVSRIIFPGETISSQLPPPRPVDCAGRYLLLTSGIYAGAVQENASIFLQLLIEYVSGNLNPQIGSSIVRMVVAGGAITPPRTQDAFKDTLTIDSKLTVEAQETLVESMRAADRWFAEIAACVPIDVMPGEYDPCNVSLPQQPLHPCLFPISSRLSTSFRTVTNPYSFVLGEDINVLGHSGQPVKDALLYLSPETKPIDFLQQSVLQFRHLAPTAPDTLACYPFYDRDPFVLDKANQRIVFAGGCKMFDTKFVQGTRFICVPNFKETNQVVLVDLNSPELEANVVSFEVKI